MSAREQEIEPRCPVCKLEGCTDCICGRCGAGPTEQCDCAAELTVSARYQDLIEREVIYVG